MNTPITWPEAIVFVAAMVASVMVLALSIAGLITIAIILFGKSEPNDSEHP